MKQFTVVLQSNAANPMPSLRMALKVLGRRFGFKCLRVEEKTVEGEKGGKDGA